MLSRCTATGYEDFFLPWFSCQGCLFPSPCILWLIYLIYTYINCKVACNRLSAAQLWLLTPNTFFKYCNFNKDYQQTGEHGAIITPTKRRTILTYCSLYIVSEIISILNFWKQLEAPQEHQHLLKTVLKSKEVKYEIQASTYT